MHYQALNRQQEVEQTMGLYLGVSLCAFGVYAAFLFADPSTPNHDRASWIVAVIAAIAWPIVLPISFFGELLPRWRKAKQAATQKQLAPAEPFTEPEPLTYGSYIHPTQKPKDYGSPDHTALDYASVSCLSAE